MSRCGGSNGVLRAVRLPIRGVIIAATVGTWQWETLEHLMAALQVQAERSRAVIEAHDLAEMGKPGPRWEGADPATLERILFHLVQEYARHLGHLDIVAELANGQLGE